MESACSAMPATSRPSLTSSTPSPRATSSNATGNLANSELAGASGSTTGNSDLSLTNSATCGRQNHGLAYQSPRTPVDSTSSVRGRPSRSSNFVLPRTTTISATSFLPFLPSSIPAVPAAPHRDDGLNHRGEHRARPADAPRAGRRCSRGPRPGRLAAASHVKRLRRKAPETGDPAWSAQLRTACSCPATGRSLAWCGRGCRSNRPSGSRR